MKVKNNKEVKSQNKKIKDTKSYDEKLFEYIEKELKFGRLGVIVLEPILSITIFTFEVVFVLTIASSSVC